MIINQPPLCCKISGESSGHVSLDKRKQLAATEEEGGSICNLQSWKPHAQLIVNL